jgi:amino-acid N-acetyltransferase
VLSAGFLPDAAFYLPAWSRPAMRRLARPHRALRHGWLGPAAGTVHPRRRGHHGLHENLESLRQATIEDVGGILKLIEPLEADGTLVKRGRELIEREIDYFSVIEHDGVIFGCAALYPSPRNAWARWPA